MRKDVAGTGGYGGRAALFWTNILILAPGEKHNIAQLRSEAERCACVAADLALGIEMSQDTHSCLSVWKRVILLHISAMLTPTALTTANSYCRLPLQTLTAGSNKAGSNCRPRLTTQQMPQSSNSLSHFISPLVPMDCTFSSFFLRILC